MRRRLMTRMTIELSLGLLSLGLAILTMINSEWIEELTGFEPDAGSGALEWAIVVTLAAVAATLGLLGVRNGLRLRHASG